MFGFNASALMKSFPISVGLNKLGMSQYCISMVFYETPSCLC